MKYFSYLQSNNAPANRLQTQGPFIKCTSPEVIVRVDPDFTFLNKYCEIDPARSICDREGDGIFIYFEPKTPATGAAAVPPQSEPGAVATGFQPDTPKAMSATA